MRMRCISGSRSQSGDAVAWMVSNFTYLQGIVTSRPPPAEQLFTVGWQSGGEQPKISDSILPVTTSRRSKRGTSYYPKLDSGGGIAGFRGNNLLYSPVYDDTGWVHSFEVNLSNNMYTLRIEQDQMQIVVYKCKIDST